MEGSRRPIAILLGALSLGSLAVPAVAAEVFEPAAPETVRPPAHTRPSPPRCRGFRWAVKTLADAGAGGIDSTPRDSSVAALASLVARRGGTSRIAPVEARVWRLSNVRLVGLEAQPDGDIHLVVADRAGHTMITELPSPACDGGAPAGLKAEMNAARSGLLSAYGDPGPGFHRIDGYATLAGVGFFDYRHHQPGVAPNAIELHPVLSFSPAALPAAARPPGPR